MKKITILSIVLIGTFQLNYGQVGSPIAPASWPSMTSLYDFENASDPTIATLGNPLTVVGGSFTSVPGPNGSDLAIHKTLQNLYLVCDHGLTATQGGARVNDYSILFDVLIPTLDWVTYYQTNLINNTDAKLFSRADGGIGNFGNYSTNAMPTSNAMVANKWYRVIVAFSAGASPDVYVDGVLWNNNFGDQSAIDGGQSLDPAGVILFGDNDGDDNPMKISKVAIFNTKLSQSDATALESSLAVTKFDTTNFSYYPTTMRDVLNLSYSKNISEVAIYNILGQEVLSKKAINATQSQINVSGLSSGTYLVKVTADNQSKTVKVVKE